MANVNSRYLLCLVLIIFCFDSHAQNADSSLFEIDLVSDTQAPLAMEEILLKANHNTLATGKIFEDIHQRKPRALFILGDVVSLGSKASKWRKMDQYLSEIRQQKTYVTAVLGNHDVMFSATKGQARFLKRFPDEMNTGFYKVYDSIAFVLLNSNFKTLKKEQLMQQQEFYQSLLQNLDGDSAVKFIVVTCHHAPYSNSKTVGSDKMVQEHFVPAFLQSKKAKLFITGHAHVFEHFKKEGKDFVTLGGGGGLHQHVNTGTNCIPSESFGYNPEFHYEIMRRSQNKLTIVSRFLQPDFSAFSNGYQFSVE